MEVYGSIKNGKLMLQHAVVLLREQYLCNLPDGCTVRETLTRVARPKSAQQVRAFWGMVVAMAKVKFDEMGIDCMGVPLSGDMVKQILYHYCAWVGDNGRIVRLSEQSTVQASVFFENCRDWLAQFGVIVPDPDPAWKSKASDKS